MAQGNTKRLRLHEGGHGGAFRQVSLAGGNSAPSAAEEPSPRAKVLALEDTMLKIVGIVGKGHHVFVAGVCKDWRGLYNAAHPALETSLQHSVIGSVECLNWAVRQGYPLSVKTFRAAAQLKDVSICEALYGHGCPWEEIVCVAAVQNAKHGLSILKWLRSDLPDKFPCPWDEWTCTLAAWGPDVDMLTWLLSDEANAPFDSSIWEWAAQKGRINVLEMLLNHPRVRPELDAADEGSRWRLGGPHAAGKGRLEVLRWLHVNARDLCDWDAKLCFMAVGKGNSLPMLQWLRSESIMCPWDKHSCPEVLLNARLWDGGRNEAFEDIKRWVHANGHPCDCED